MEDYYMKKIIIDTDIGVDFDDVLALMTGIALQNEGVIGLDGVSVGTARENASACASAVCDYYGFKTDIPVFHSEKIPCDNTNVYATAVAEKFNGVNGEEDTVRFLRRKLAAAEDKVTFACIGPLSAVSRLIDSVGDDISPLMGNDLISEKVERFYCMAGNFSYLHPELYTGKFNYVPEWNIVQGIKAAQNFINKVRVPVTLVPFEVGGKVLSGATLPENSLAGFAIRHFYKINYKEFPGCFLRQSWDPITVALASGLDIAEVSENGTITIADDGKTDFIPGKGNHSYAFSKYDEKTVADMLDSLYAELVGKK